ncbi:MAG: hypothetical protein ACWGMZ_10290, partial [Thermoguttaceae bacterium]
NLPEAVSARYLLANCFRQMALADRKKLKLNSPEDDQTLAAKQVKKLFAQALREFRQVQETLSLKSQNSELDATQRAILRNTYFACAEMLFDQGNFEGAAKAYCAAANRYQN